MTDRFYPVPAKAEPSHVTPGMAELNIGPFNDQLYQTSYTSQNAMHTLTRSAFPPGYGGHQPGIRDKFGYGSPGPEVGVLQRPDSAPGLKALAQTQHDDALDQLWDKGPNKDKSAWGLSKAPKPMTRSYSVKKWDRPLGLAASAQRLLEGPLEDSERKYFVPSAMMQMEPLSRVLLNKNRLASVEAADPLVAGSGIGTGFNTQSPGVSWWPAEGVPAMTMYRVEFRQKPYHPKSGFIVR